jgi:tRNA (guanine-N7-)-methyltransferase
MDEFPNYRLNLTKDLRIQNYYTLAMDGEFKDKAFNEERAPLKKGRWRSEVFAVSDETPLDLEIGTGNGTHFEHHAIKNPNRCLVGLEIKYKPLVQTIRRTLRAGAKNAAVARFHAFCIDQLFVENELNNVYIHFPDPWTSPRKPKNRIVQKCNLDLLWKLQRPQATINFKTDSAEAFEWCLEEAKKTQYAIDFLTRDLHNSEAVQGNFITAFEKIFLREGLPIHLVRLRKNI